MPLAGDVGFNAVHSPCVLSVDGRYLLAEFGATRTRLAERLEQQIKIAATLDRRRQAIDIERREVGDEQMGFELIPVTSGMTCSRSKLPAP